MPSNAVELDNSGIHLWFVARPDEIVVLLPTAVYDIFGRLTSTLTYDL